MEDTSEQTVIASNKAPADESNQTKAEGDVTIYVDSEKEPQKPKWKRMRKAVVSHIKYRLVFKIWPF